MVPRSRWSLVVGNPGLAGPCLDAWTGGARETPRREPAAQVPSRSREGQQLREPGSGRKLYRLTSYLFSQRRFAFFAPNSSLLGGRFIGGAPCGGLVLVADKSKAGKSCRPASPRWIDGEGNALHILAAGHGLVVVVGAFGYRERDEPESAEAAVQQLFAFAEASLNVRPVTGSAERVAMLRRASLDGDGSHTLVLSNRRGRGLS